MHMRLAIMLTALLLAAITAAQEPKPHPSFDDFPAKKIWKGKPAAPKLVNKDQRMFRTRIRLGAKAPVKFAGHYTVPGWGCGTSCIGFVIVDSITGKIYDGLGVEYLPGAWLEGHAGDSYKPIDLMEFHPSSRLLKIDGCLDEQECGFYDYEMVDGRGLKLIRKELLPKHYQPECDYGTSDKIGCSSESCFDSRTSISSSVANPRDQYCCLYIAQCLAIPFPYPRIPGGCLP